ncbi:MAG: hypothetical protein ABEJ02_04915 [Candidatus Paceibacteria bacterium]
MSNKMIQKKILDLENTIKVLKKEVQSKPDFDIDEENWDEIKDDVKEIRSNLYQGEYGQ